MRTHYRPRLAQAVRLQGKPGPADTHQVSEPDLVIHGHFYQPPRENPWTEKVDRERSATPFHDWNERITAESYRPNTVARIVDEGGDIVGLVNNYSLMSYNVGPTLMSWLEHHAPDTYERIVAADAEGHGAIAQVFGHTILPLATEADARLQVQWGLADFRYRFGREAEGIWLAECAVNDMVLRVLAEEGVKFTVLAPGQAAKIRSLNGDHDWVDVDHSWFDTSRPYRWVHPDGDKHVDIVFYNGALSHSLAFEMSSMSSQNLIDRMVAAGHGRNGLVTVAADGETLGHHHRYGDRLVAYALSVEARRRGLVATNLNNVVAAHTPTHEVRVHESAWSCAHGVGRWKEDCSCSTGAQPGWNQKWRGPLRSALDTLRARVEQIWSQRSADVFVDAEAARRCYVSVMIGEDTRKNFAVTHITGDAVEAFTLLEMQRHAQSMFTSCGWFFNDLSGIETVQVLRYAARVFDLIEELGEDPHRDAFLAILGQAHSNVEGHGSGVDIWNRDVMSARVDPMRVVEHVVLSEVLESEDRNEFGPYEIEFHHRTKGQRGSKALASGTVVMTHRHTGRSWQFSYAAIGLGGLEVAGTVVPGDARATDALRQAFAEGAPAAMLLRLLNEIDGEDFDLSVALPDERDRFVADTARILADRYTDAYARLYQSHRATLEDLTRYGYELPSDLRAPAEVALAQQFQDAVLGAERATERHAYEDAVNIAHQARAAGFVVDTPKTREFLERLIDDTVINAVTYPSATTVQTALNALALRNDLGLDVDLSKSQEVIHWAMNTPTDTTVLHRLATALHVRPGAISTQA